MKSFFKISTTLAAVAMFATGSGVAVGQLPNQNWTGNGDGTSFLDAANWDSGTTAPGIVPSTGDRTNNFINGDVTIDRSVDSNVNRCSVETGAVLNITGGEHSDSESAGFRYTFIGGTGSGTVNQSGGSWNIGHGLRVGTGSTSGDGVYNLTGGSLIVSRTSNARLGTGAPDFDPVAMTGPRPSLEVGDGGSDTSGLFEISGASSLQTRAGVHVLDTGTFSVVGSTATEIGIGSNQNADGTWVQTAGSTLRAGLDAGGLTVILIDEVDGDGGGDVFFADGAILDPYDAGNANNAWTSVMSWEGILTDNGLVLSPAALSAGWEMRVEGSDLQVRNLNFGPPVGIVGDFNGDMVVDCDDIDAYIGNLGSAATVRPELDLVVDGTINADDQAFFVETLVETTNGQVGTFLGDVNCDGTVNVLGDAFNLVFGLGSPATSYSQGDINLDGQINVLGDALILVSNLGMNNAP